MDAVLDYLQAKDTAAYHLAKDCYACFDSFGDDSQQYGFISGLGLAPSCEKEVKEELVDMHARQSTLEGMDGDDFFTAAINAKVFHTCTRSYLLSDRLFHTGDRGCRGILSENV